MMLDKICKQCGQPFQTLQPYQEYCNREHFKNCIICQAPFHIDVKNANSRKKQTCSRSCSSQLRKQTLFNTLHVCEYCGCEFNSESSKAKLCRNLHYANCRVCGKRFLISNEQILNNQIPLTCSIECKEKQRRATNLSVYGEEIASKSDVVRDKLRISALQSSDKKSETCLIRYGTKNAAQNLEVRQKISNTLKSKHSQ